MPRDRPSTTRCSRTTSADEAERRDRDAVAALVAAPTGASTGRFYTPGHITGSAFVVDAASGRVLLHHHRRLDRWLQLGGHDDGEHDPLATALREGREESGLLDLRPLSTAILDIDVHEIPAGRSEPAHLHHDVRYALQTSTRKRSRSRTRSRSTWRGSTWPRPPAACPSRAPTGPPPPGRADRSRVDRCQAPIRHAASRCRIGAWHERHAVRPCRPGGRCPIGCLAAIGHFSCDS